MQRNEHVALPSTKGYIRVTVIAAVIGYISVIAAGCSQSPQVPNTPGQPVEIQYVGRVIDAENKQPIEQAKVSLDLQGVPPIVYTDSEGIYQFKLLIGSDISGTVRVDAQGYETYIRNITISPRIHIIEDIRLTSQSSASGHAGETPTNTPAPTMTPTQAPTEVPALPPTATSELVPISDRDIPMVLIPAGFFEMYAKPTSNQIYVNAFYIDQHEVTNGEYKKCVEAKSCLPPYRDADPQFANVVHYGIPAYDNYPVVLVSWNMAHNYCQWRGTETRLPTDVEWEKAARGGLVGQSYPWGSTPPVCSPGAPNGSNYLDCGSKDAVPIELYSPNGYGIYDMSGNVAEWTDTVVSDTARMIRGGSWYDDENQAMVYAAARGEILNGYVNVGFRCVQSTR